MAWKKQQVVAQTIPEMILLLESCGSLMMHLCCPVIEVLCPLVRLMGGSHKAMAANRAWFGDAHG